MLLMLDSLAFRGLKKLGLTDEQIVSALQDFRRLLLVVMYNFEFEDLLKEYIGAVDEDIEHVEKMFEMTKKEFEKGGNQ